MPATQSYSSHTRWVPPYHFFTLTLLIANLVWSLWKTFKFFSVDTVIATAVAIALIMMFFYARLFALTVQDRVIRLEEQLRLERLLPADLRGRIPELTRSQLVALRFASDGELPELVRAVCDEKIHSRKEIKRRIRDWRADHLRA